ncbi:MAG: pseudouridine synthase [Erysipelotrichaceae bacterium]
MRHAYQIDSKIVNGSDIIKHEEKQSVRLNKYIASSGYCSRREADRYIEEGKVSIDGIIAQIGTKVFPNQLVVVDHQEIETEERMVYIALHKPCGITCTTDTEMEDNITDFLNYPLRVFPIGRLDKESSGLILITNDGDIVNKVLRSNNGHEKEYIVSVNKNIDCAFLEAMRNGIQIYNPVSNSYQVTKPCLIEQIGPKSFNLILTEGLNRQIRRMCSALGYVVRDLKRIRVMNIELDDMGVGGWRYLNEDELVELNNIINKTTL